MGDPIQKQFFFQLGKIIFKTKQKHCNAGRILYTTEL